MTESDLARMHAATEIFYLLKSESIHPALNQGERITEVCKYQDVEIMESHLRDSHILSWKIDEGLLSEDSLVLSMSLRVQ